MKADPVRRRDPGGLLRPRKKLLVLNVAGSSSRIASLVGNEGLWSGWSTWKL